MEVLNLIQGSAEWRQSRLEHFTASEAPAMMGVSKYMSREDLLKLKKTGIEKEFNEYTLKLFAKGHATEALARPIVEEFIGDELYPVTGRLFVEGLPLLASFDGLTMMFDIGFEHKLWNEKVVTQIKARSLDPMYYWQLEQQLLISKAEKIVFTTSDGTADNMERMEYYPVKGRAEQLIAGWQQFAVDLEGYECADVVEKVIAEPTLGLPAVSIKVDGTIALIDNLDIFGEALKEYISKINKKPETDQDFANLESAIKTLKTAEDALNSAENSALAQAESIDIMRKTVELYRSMARSNRLTTEKLVKNEKTARKLEIATNAENDRLKHQADLNNTLGGHYIEIRGDFNSAMKGKKTITSLQSAANDELARCKIMANELFITVGTNIKKIPTEYNFLFNDLAQIVLKQTDDFALLVDSRVNEHKQAEEAKLEVEREKIRLEEAVKAQKIIDDAEAAKVKIVDKSELSDVGFTEESQKPATPHSTGIKEDAKPIPRKERDANTDLVEAEVMASLLEHFGAQTAKKMTILLVTKSIKNVTINY